MAKTRLLESDRNVIRDAIVAHKYDPMEKALAAEGHALAQAVWEHLYDEAARRWISKAPKGALPISDNIRVNAGGQSHWLNFAKPTRVFFAHHGYSNDVALPLSHDLCGRVRDHASAERKTAEERSITRRETSGAIAGFRNFEDLMEAWPEAASFVKARLISRGGSAPLPAPIFADLSKKLDLPPDTEALAA